MKKTQPYKLKVGLKMKKIQTYILINYTDTIDGLPKVEGVYSSRLAAQKRLDRLECNRPDGLRSINAAIIKKALSGSSHFMCSLYEVHQ